MTSTILNHRYSGKVRDIYDGPQGELVMVTSDRISAFDIVMNEPIMDKGRVLTAMSSFWFDYFADIIPNHIISTDLAYLGDAVMQAHPDWAGRIMICRPLEMLKIECIVRGYISGSAWKEYKQDGTMHGTVLPTGLLESSQLPEPVFTPSTKADEGHDINVSFEDAASIVGIELATQAKELSLMLYKIGAELAATRGIIIADTKFEMGVVDGQLVLADEVLTPDSSRFWPVDAWVPGETPPSFDKQPIRDYLETTSWDKQVPPPTLPQEVLSSSRTRYIEAYERITKKSFADWPGVS